MPNAFCIFVLCISVVIDLHTHTTASDGRDDPEALVGLASNAGLRVIAVTDHDTVAGVARAARAGALAGIEVVPGIEITAVDDRRDVHVLGYFIDASCDALHAFLSAQRRDRIRRVRDMADRLTQLGFAIDIDEALHRAGRDATRSIGRPVLARALVAAGHARDTQDAFARFIGSGCPAFVPRSGAPPAEVIALIRRAGGVASLAHPGKTACDDRLPALVAAGLAALEVRHPDHPPSIEAKYSALARQLGLAITAGSDYHGTNEHGSPTLGHVTMSEEEFELLQRRRPGVSG